MASDPYEDIKLILQSWAIYRVLGLSGLSYPSSTVEARLMEYGAITGSTPGPRVIRYVRHMTCSDVDKIVREWPYMGGKWPRRYLAVWCHYVGKDGKGMELPEKLIACGCSERTFWRSLAKAHEVLDLAIVHKPKNVLHSLAVNVI